MLGVRDAPSDLRISVQGRDRGGEVFRPLTRPARLSELPSVRAGYLLTLPHLKRQIEQFVALGYRGGQFSYQSTELQTTLDQIPAAELEVTRAERANAQFRDDARRRDIMPGWLR